VRQAQAHDPGGNRVRNSIHLWPDFPDTSDHSFLQDARCLDSSGQTHPQKLIRTAQACPYYYMSAASYHYMSVACKAQQVEHVLLLWQGQLLAVYPSARKAVMADEQTAAAKQDMSTTVLCLACARMHSEQLPVCGALLPYFCPSLT